MKIGINKPQWGTGDAALRQKQPIHNSAYGRCSCFERIDKTSTINEQVPEQQKIYPDGVGKIDRLW